MKSIWITALMIVIGLLAVGANAATPSSHMPAEFEVLTRKSIFSNLPGRPANDHDSRHRNTPPPGLPVLVGIIREEAKFVAVVEDPVTGKTLRLVPGEALPQNGGTIAELTLDSMSVKTGSDGAQKKIMVGQTITGGAPTFSMPGDGSSAGPGTEGAAASESPAAPAGSAEERMRLRRLQQQGK